MSAVMSHFRMIARNAPRLTRSSTISLLTGAMAFLGLRLGRRSPTVSVFRQRLHLRRSVPDLALKDGVPAYVTAVAATDVADGWREHRDSGGLLIDVPSGQTVAAGFSMPHSPRVHEGAVYLLDSGTGQFGTVDLAIGRFEPMAFCPGYLHGLAFVDRFAIVGISRPRPATRTLQGLKLDAALADKGVSARHGILVIDLKRGDIVHWLHVQGVVQELYDVAVLPSVVRPMALGFKTDEIRRALTIEDSTQ